MQFYPGDILICSTCNGSRKTKYYQCGDVTCWVCWGLGGFSAATCRPAAKIMISNKQLRMNYSPTPSCDPVEEPLRYIAWIRIDQGKNERIYRREIGSPSHERALKLLSTRSLIGLDKI